MKKAILSVAMGVLMTGGLAFAQNRPAAPAEGQKQQAQGMQNGRRGRGPGMAAQGGQRGKCDGTGPKGNAGQGRGNCGNCPRR